MDSYGMSYYIYQSRVYILRGHPQLNALPETTHRSSLRQQHRLPVICTALPFHEVPARHVRPLRGATLKSLSDLTKGPGS